MTKIWTEAEIQDLVTLRERGYVVEDIALKLGRSTNSITGKMRTLGLFTGTRNRKRNKTVSVISKETDNMPLKIMDVPSADWTNKSGWRPYLVLPDAHTTSDSDDTTLNVVMDFMRDFKPYSVVLGGDFMDMSCVSHWNKTKKRTLEGKRLKADYIKANKIIAKMKESTSKLVYMIGNHEDWVDQAICEDPSLEGFYEVKNNISGVDEWVDNNGVYSIGRLKIIHGFFTPDHACKRHLQEFHDSVMFCHTHRIQTYSGNIYGVRPICSWNIGCLCSMNPEYAHNKAPQWQHGFAVVWENAKTRNFFVEQVWIIENKMIYGGKIYG